MDSKFVIVGGGAGGLELACKLGRKMPGEVTLVDCRQYHVWKPSLHEVAAGTLDIHQEGLSYELLANNNGFIFVYGALTALDTAARRVTVGPAPVPEPDEAMPERSVGYGTLVLALGSISNYFGVPGAPEHTISLNATEDAEHFRLKLLKLLTLASMRKEERSEAGVDIVIVGGGATGVELAAELRQASERYLAYGFRQLQARDVRITLLEGAARVLEPLPERVSAAALALLGERAISVHTGTRVTAVEATRVSVAAGPPYPADICVWAAGIRAPPLLASLGLPVNRAGQVEVGKTLAVNGFPHLYAMGDCAACPGPGGKLVPPRAQAAHQQADYLLDSFLRQMAGKPPPGPYRYRDYGALVSFGRQTSVGTLMGALRGRSWFVEGMVARLMYIGLHLRHHRAVLGVMRTGILALARFLIKRGSPLLKLH